jgi:pimeloyl-ACP methyl ester carboxylesterase
MRFEFTSQRQSLHMAYMDVRPQKWNGRTTVLLHGKNYCAATWYRTIVALVAAGYRVIAPDQIGFCKSSKPERYQYTFQQLARNTHALLVLLGVTDSTLIAHSAGGMIAARYALMYPKETEKDLAPPNIRMSLGHYPDLGKRAAERIPGAHLVEFPELGHAPQIQDPDVVPQGAPRRARFSQASLGRRCRDPCWGASAAASPAPPILIPSCKQEGQRHVRTLTRISVWESRLTVRSRRCWSAGSVATRMPWRH